GRRPRAAWWADQTPQPNIASSQPKPIRIALVSAGKRLGARAKPTTTHRPRGLMRRTSVRRRVVSATPALYCVSDASTPAMADRDSRRLVMAQLEFMSDMQG